MAVLPFLMITVALLVVVMLAVALALVITQRGTHAAPRKPKRRLEEDAPPDPYLDELADGGRLTLADDGELPDWIDDLPEKPKRADRE